MKERKNGLDGGMDRGVGGGWRGLDIGVSEGVWN